MRLLELDAGACRCGAMAVELEVRWLELEVRRLEVRCDGWR